MIKKWDVAPQPNEKNPARHKLLIKGEMKDIFLIVKKLGSVCSRPEKTSGEFNFLIYLSKLEMDTMKKLKEVTTELSAVIPEEADSFGDEPAPFESPRPKFNVGFQPFADVAPQAAPAAVPEPAPEAAAEPAPEPMPQAVPAAVPEPAPEAAAEPAPEPMSQAAPAAVPEPAPEAAAEPSPEPMPKTAPAAASAQSPAPESEQNLPAPAQPVHGTMAGMNVPSLSARTRKDEPKAASAEIPAARPASKPAASSRSKTKWSMETPLIPTCSFQTLIAGSHNRFAHAAAMAVVENPGVIYNPLLIFGAPGTGKTHFVNSIYYGLSAALGPDNIFVTDGIKFSKGLELAIKDGGIARLEELFSKVKLLIVDDIHLLMVSPANKKYISKWLNDFVAQNKQIVVTSVFPPKSLAGLEDAAGFQFTQGWMVDLKPPGAQAYKAILAQLFKGMEVKLSEEEAAAIFAKNLMPLGEAVKVMESMRKLEKFLVNAKTLLSHAQLFDMLLGFTEVPASAGVTEEDSRRAAAWQPAAADTWFKWGIFHPKNMRREAEFALFSLHERTKELGLNTEWSQVFIEAYDSDELYGIPFKIGNYASERNVNGAVILGPQPTSALGTQEGEFRHITSRILDSFMVKNAWLPVSKLKSKAAYTKALIDLI